MSVLQRELRERIAALSPERRADLEARLLQRRDGPDSHAITVRDRAFDPPPLSLPQQRLWFLQRLDPNSTVFNLTRAIRLQGRLDVTALERSLAEIVRRHEALRTTFDVVDGRPVQVVHDAIELPFALEQVRGLSAEEREVTVRIRALEDAQRPFDLERGPLVRARLLRLFQQEYVLLFTLHHLVTDAWSNGVLFRELASLYAAFAADQPSPLPDLPIQYADFAVWQRNAIQGTALAGQLAYWRRQLAATPAACDLPTDRPRPAVQTFRGARRRLTVPAPVTAALKALGREEGATLFMTLLAAWQALLARYSGQEDIVVGSPIAGRGRVETEPLIGFFVNTLALRGTVAADSSYRVLLRQARDAALEAYAHQDVPFERLVEVLQPERDLSRAPIFQTMFTLRNAPRTPLVLPGLTLSPVEVDPGTAQVDLALDLREVEGGLRGRLEYNADLFDAAAIGRLADHLQTLLTGIVADPECPVSTLPLLTEAERSQVLVEWNAPRAAHETDACLHDLFEAQVERSPDAVAVVFAEERLTYRELNRRANQLARHLRTLGVGRETPVGLCLERSAEMVIGVLGILKAGGAYVPLDPSYPHDRLTFMREDAGVDVVVTHRALAPTLETADTRLFCLDAERGDLDRQSTANLDGGATPDRLAYLIYTSGSTGQPKGVLGLHRGAINRCRWMWEAFPFLAAEVCCQTSSLSFVDSVWELFGPLLAGVPLVILPEGVRGDPDRLVATLAAGGVTRLVVVPSLLATLIEAYPDLGRRLPVLRSWSTSAEVLPPALVGRFFEAVPEGLLLNLYGSSEAAADATYHEVTRHDAALARVPIGRPLANVRVYVLDSHGQPVPVGVPGELHVGGAGVARGYHNRPVLTAERFIPDPFGGEPEASLYRTGDLARYRADGRLEYLGRIDHQVKVRGHRVEVGEVEAVLGEHPAVREQAIAARDDGTGGQRLVAYVVVDEEAAPTIGELRAFLKKKLPEFMLPASFVVLDALPLTSNGKLDREALPVPVGERSRLDAAFVPPQTPTEERVAGVWRDVLGLERVGVDDNFFDLGGHSLLAVQVMARLGDASGRQLPLRTLFEAPTVGQLAGRIDDDSGAESVPDGATAPRLVPLVAPRPDLLAPPIFAVPGADGNEMHLVRLARLARYLDLGRPFYGFLVAGADGGTEQPSVEAVAAEYVRHVRERQPVGPYVLLGACVGGLVAFEMAQQLVSQGETVTGLILVDTRRPQMQRYDRARPRRRKDRGLPARVETLLRYQPSRYPGRVTLFLNERWHAQNPTLGWWSLAGGGIDTHVLPGDHRLFQPERIQVLADRLRPCLDEMLRSAIPQ